MEDVEDDFQIDDYKWEDMELEDDMENMVDLSSFLAYKIVQSSCYSTCQVYWKQKFNFFNDDLGGDASSGASPAFLSDHEFQHKYRIKRASLQELSSLIQDHPVFPSSTRHIEKDKTIYTSTPTNGVSHNHISKNLHLFQDFNSYFSEHEYLHGGMGFKCFPFIIGAYKWAGESNRS